MKKKKKKKKRRREIGSGKMWRCEDVRWEDERCECVRWEDVRWEDVRWEDVRWENVRCEDVRWADKRCEDVRIADPFFWRTLCSDALGKINFRNILGNPTLRKYGESLNHLNDLTSHSTPPPLPTSDALELRWRQCVDPGRCCNQGSSTWDDPCHQDVIQLQVHPIFTGEVCSLILGQNNPSQWCPKKKTMSLNPEVQGEALASIPIDPGATPCHGSFFKKRTGIYQNGIPYTP